MATKVGICNTALLFVGADQIQSFDDEVREARICSQIYKDTKLSLLQKYPWNFTLEQIQLAETAAEPLFEFENSFQIPPNTLRVIKKDNSPNNYKIFQDKVFSNAETVTLVRQIDPGEADYPSYFTRALELKLAELLALALVQDESMSESYLRKYNVQIREARSIDSQNDPPSLINPAEFAITSIRVQGNTSG